MSSLFFSYLFDLKKDLRNSPAKMDPKTPPKAITEPTQEEPSSSIPNPVILLRNWRLAAFVQPVRLPQLNIPMDTKAKYSNWSQLNPDSQRSFETNLTCKSCKCLFPKRNIFETRLKHGWRKVFQLFPLLKQRCYEEDQSVTVWL